MSEKAEITIHARPADRQAVTKYVRLPFTRHYTKHAEGSVLVEFGDTKVFLV